MGTVHPEKEPVNQADQQWLANSCYHINPVVTWTVGHQPMEIQLCLDIPFSQPWLET